MSASSPIITERQANSACDTLKKSGAASEERGTARVMYNSSCELDNRLWTGDVRRDIVNNL
jgi:hypothetical protein